MGEWDSNSKTQVAHMQNGDYYSSETSIICNKASTLRIELKTCDGKNTTLKDNIKVQNKEILDMASININMLKEFFAKEISSAKKQEILLSLHLKATMMKVSDPIIFGHAVTSYYAKTFEEYEKTLKDIGVNPKNGIGDLLAKIKLLPPEKQIEIEQSIDATYE